MKKRLADKLKRTAPSSGRVCAAFALALCLSATPPAFADESWRGLHEKVQAGAVLPLGAILDSLLLDWEGQVVDVEFEQEGGRQLYEIELLGAEGQVVEFEVDAVTGELIGIEGSNINSMKRP